PIDWVISRRQLKLHAQVIAPARKLQRVILAPWLGTRAKRDATGLRNHRLKVERLEHQLGTVAADNILQLRTREVCPRRRKSVVVREFDHITRPEGQAGASSGNSPAVPGEAPANSSNFHLYRIIVSAARRGGEHPRRRDGERPYGQA